MSTTKDKKVAMQYAASGGRGVVFEIQQGMIDRGADIGGLSQYPHEAEILFAPLTGLEVQSTRCDKTVLVVGVGLGSISRRSRLSRSSASSESWGDAARGRRLRHEGADACVDGARECGWRGGARAARMWRAWPCRSRCRVFQRRREHGVGCGGGGQGQEGGAGGQEVRACGIKISTAKEATGEGERAGLDSEEFDVLLCDQYIQRGGIARILRARLMSALQ